MEFRWTVKFLENRMFLTEIEASVSILVYMRDGHFWDVRFFVCETNASVSRKFLSVILC